MGLSRVAYVNGRYLPHHEAAVHVEDRGYQFADGVYEVIAVCQGRLIDEARHLDRLERSLGELRIPMPMSRAAFAAITRETVRRNLVRDGIVYQQITRGVAKRDHAFPTAVKPAVVMTARATRPHSATMIEDGIAVITVPDVRWGRCDIKSVSLLPNCLAKQQAKEAGAFEAWQVDGDGFVTEGTSTNAWIVDADGALITRDLSAAILSGITRKALMELAEAEGLRVVERRFTRDEALAAREAFLTSTTSFLLPVVRIDDKVIANGKPGTISRKLRAQYESYMRGEAPAIG
jgi:D-alanine transaminase